MKSPNLQIGLRALQSVSGPYLVNPGQRTDVDIGVEGTRIDAPHSRKQCWVKHISEVGLLLRCAALWLDLDSVFKTEILV